MPEPRPVVEDHRTCGEVRDGPAEQVPDRDDPSPAGDRERGRLRRGAGRADHQVGRLGEDDFRGRTGSASDVYLETVELALEVEHEVEKLLARRPRPGDPELAADCALGLEEHGLMARLGCEAGGLEAGGAAAGDDYPPWLGRRRGRCQEDSRPSCGFTAHATPPA